MAAEIENKDEQQQNESAQDQTKSKILQSSIVQFIVKFLGWGVAVFVGLALMIVTMIIVLDVRGDSPEDRSIVDPEIKVKPPIWGVQRLDQFSINLDKTDDSDKTYIVTAVLVLAYPKDREEIAQELNERKEQISDAIQSVISRKRFEDINSADKRQNTLKEELKYEVNRNLINKGIVDIFITKFEIQKYG